MTLPIAYPMTLAAILFALGLLGLTMRRNLLFVLISLEIMLNAAGLAFIIAGAQWAAPQGQVMFILVITLAAAEVSVGLGLLLQLRHRVRSLDIDAVNTMRG